MHSYFMCTKRISFSKWTVSDLNLATELWGIKKLRGLFVHPVNLQRRIFSIVCRRKSKMEKIMVFSIGLFLILNLVNLLAAVGCDHAGTKNWCMKLAATCTKSTGERVMLLKQCKRLYSMVLLH